MQVVLRNPSFFLILLAMLPGLPLANAAPPRADLQIEADERYADGDYAQAAEAYLQAATLVPAPDRNPMLIRASEAALQAERRDLASQTLRKLDPARLTPAQRVRVDLLLASLGQLPGGPKDWLQRLPAPGKDADADLAERLWAARADAHLREGDVIEGIQALVRREALLGSGEARARNQSRIWSALRTTPPVASQFQNRAELDTVTRGWLELAMLQRAVWSDPGERSDSLDQWEARYPGHPARDTVLDLVRDESGMIARPSPASPGAGVIAKPAAASILAAAPASLTGSGRVGTLALMLPLSGSLAAAGRAIRDGFMAAWYAQPAPRPRVLVFDSGSGPDGALAVYERALAAGADMVVGPLSRDAVASLSRMITPSQPLLALNYLEPGQPAPANFFQFGLAPEDEAAQVAERALADGHRRAAALVPEGDWGRRTLAAFRERFEAQGGQLLETASFESGLGDFSEPVRRALRLQGSEPRKHSPNAVPGDSAPFSGNPDALPDFVFIAAQPQQARLIRPQFRFLGAGQLPIYATSLVYEGSLAPSRDADLDDIRFCDMPFLIGGGEASTVRERIRGLWPDSFTRHARLYAFGHDAARLAQQLAQGGSREFEGVTGQLRVGADGRVQRGLLWARFENGRPQPLPGSNPNLP